MAAKVILFVEGEPNSTNGDLRQGISKLLEQKLKSKLPRIIMGGGKTQTINKFLTNQLHAENTFLLIDLDKTEEKINKDLEEYLLFSRKENVFYMVQEMESWFLSQTEILDQYYGFDNNKKLISEKILKRKACEINEPDKELIKLTKNTKRGQYHKIKHAVELIKLLNSDKLELEFEQYRKLINTLQSII